MTTRRGRRVTLLVAGAALVLGGCELISAVDRSQIETGPDESTGGSDSGGSDSGGSNSGGSNSGGSNGEPGGAAGMGGAPSSGGETSTGGTSTGGGSSNTCPTEGLGGAPGTPDVPEIVGSYFSGTDESNTFETPELIGDETWTQGSDEPWVYYHATVDNENDMLIAQNGEENWFFGCLWSRFVWFETDGNLYFCQDVFDAESHAEAEMAESGANTSDLNTGCLGAGWYRLVAQ